MSVRQYIIVIVLISGAGCRKHSTSEVVGVLSPMLVQLGKFCKRFLCEKHFVKFT